MLNVSSSNLETLWFIPQPYPQIIADIFGSPQGYPHYPQIFLKFCG